MTSGQSTSLVVGSAAEMAALGTALGQQLAPGDAVCLVGPLGAGKTTFTRGLASGLEIRGEVTSPTFVIARRHRGLRVDLLHCDAYRISGLDEFADLDLDTDEAVTVVEWGQSVMAEITDSWLEVALDRSSSHDEGTRQVTVHGRGDRWTTIEVDLVVAAFRQVIS